MNRYGPKAQGLIQDVIHRQASGRLKSSNGRTVKSRKQAIAIGISEARSKGYKVPKK